MSYTLANFLQDVSSRINNEDGTVTASLVTSYVTESLRRVRRKYDLPSAEVITQFPLYSGVFLYALPYSGFKDFVALRDNFQPFDQVFMRNVDQDTFWSNLQSGNIRSEQRNGTARTLLFNLLNPSTSSAVLNNALGATTDGTWVASGDAANVRTDTLFFREGSSSLCFDIVPSTGTATLTNSTMSPKNLSGVAYLLTAMFTPWYYFPSSIAYTGFTLRFGSDASNYYQISTTTQIDGSGFVTGWNQIGFDWLTATTVGTPVSSALDYVQVSMTFPTSIGTQTGLRLNDIRARQRRLLNLHSTTDFLIIDGSTGLPKETFTSSTDTLSYFNVDRSFTDYFLYETLTQIFTSQINDPDARAYYDGKMKELEETLNERYPSTRQPMVGSYMNQSTNDMWLRRGQHR